ncbi:MAG: hypothetical protein ACYC6Y_24715 [Thermoguttaceae bacterium]
MITIRYTGDALWERIERAVEMIENTRMLRLDALVRMKLTSYRRKDQVHLLDMLEVGLIDGSWLEKVPSELRARLQELIDHPDG